MNAHLASAPTRSSPPDAASVQASRHTPIHLHLHFYVAGALLLLALVVFELWFQHLRSIGVGQSLPLSRPLKSIPLNLPPWRGTEYSLPIATQQIAGCDDYVLRDYTDPAGSHLNVYVAFFGGIRLAAPHRPSFCMPGAGYTIASSYRRSIHAQGMGETQDISAHVDVYSRDFDKDMIVWWEYIHGKNVTSEWRERLRWVLPLFLGGKAGSVVQVQIRLPVNEGDEDKAYRRIVDFIQVLTPEVGKCLPEVR